MWRRTWSSPSTTPTNCTSAEQRTRWRVAPPHRAATIPRPSPRPRQARPAPGAGQPRVCPPEFSEAVCGRPPLVRAGDVRGAGQRPGWAKAQHRGIFCVSCLNGRLMLRGRSWVRSQGSAEPAGMRSSARHSGAPPTSAARAPHGTSPFPVTRVSQSRSAEDLSGARRSPSATRATRATRGRLDAGCGCARRRRWCAGRRPQAAG
jgi:hypothetical protein